MTDDVDTDSNGRGQSEADQIEQWFLLKLILAERLLALGRSFQRNSDKALFISWSRLKTSRIQSEYIDKTVPRSIDEDDFSRHGKSLTRRLRL